MAKKRPWFPFFASDWLGSTKRAMMTPDQRGAYIDLLAHQWNTPDCTLPDDDEALAALSGLGEGWLNGASRLLRLCFPPASGKLGYLANERLVEIRAEADAQIEKSQQGGIRSGEVRRAKAEAARAYEDSQAAKGTSTTLRTQREPKGNPPEPQPQPKEKKKPRPPKKEKKKPRPPKTKDVPTTHTPLPEALESPEFRKAWADWEKHRKEIKKPLTPTSVSRCLNQLAGLGVRKAIVMIDHTIAMGWQGLREPEGNNHKEETDVPRTRPCRE